MAFAGARFANSVLRVMNGEANVVECAYVKSDAVKGAEYFSTPVTLGPNGVEKIHGTGKLTSFEQKLLEAAMSELNTNIKAGAEFVTKKK